VTGILAGDQNSWPNRPGVDRNTRVSQPSSRNTPKPSAKPEIWEQNASKLELAGEEEQPATRTAGPTVPVKTETPGYPNSPAGTHQTNPPPSQISENRPQEKPSWPEKEQQPVKGETGGSRRPKLRRTSG